jgi:hypothetical protein
MQDGINGPEEVPFLSEGEIPKSDRSDGSAGFLGGDSQTGHSTSDASTSASDAKTHEKLPSSGVLPPPDTRTSTSFETPSGITPDAAKINSLVSLGFTHTEVVTALQAVNGDVDAAAELLLVSRS